MKVKHSETKASTSQNVSISRNAQGGSKITKSERRYFIEEIFFKNNCMLLKKTIADITRQSEQRNKKQTIELRQEQNKLLIEENQSKTTLTEMHVES